ncbi:MAG: uracil-DNA glycosylase [Bdellovibrionales bacterium]
MTECLASLPQVPYDYPADRKNWSGIALVGEAPGADEVRQGRPFCGRSGQLLNAILARAGLDRPQCLVANVFRYQPPGNKVGLFFLSRRAAQTQGISLADKFGAFAGSWCRADYAPEIDHLAASLAELKPSIIVALGRTPLWALTGENGLLDKVGKSLPCRLLTGCSVIPTYHPSFILRGNWGLQENWRAHLEMARRMGRS